MSVISMIDKKVEEYASLREQQGLIKKRMDTLATEIKDYALKNGSKDDKGSCYLENDSFTFGAMAKTSINLNQEEAIAFLKGRKFTDAIKVVTMESVDEQKLEEHINNGDIDSADLEAMTTCKTTFSVSVLKKEVMPEVQVSAVASARPKSKIFKRG